MKRLFVIAISALLLIPTFVSLVSSSKIQPQQIQYVPNNYKTAVLFDKNVGYANRDNAVLKNRLVIALQEYFDKAIRRRQVVGAAVGIVKCDSTIYLGGFGKRDIKRKEAIDKETIFRVGSLSKGFAGVLAGIQVEKGLLAWNDKVVDYIPEFKIRGNGRTEKITLSTILSHSSGLPYHSFTNLVEDGLALKDIAGEFDQLIPVAEPGQLYSYQNAIYALSGEMIAKSANKSIGEVMKEDIFEPLGMSTASTDYESLIAHTNIAMPHKRRYGRWRTRPINSKYYNAVAAGGVNASIADMAKWMRFLLGHNQDILSSAMLNQVLTPTITIDGNSKYYQKWKGHISSHYGFGWRIHSFMDDYTNKPSKIIHHGGTVSNYRSEIAVYPDEDLGICVLFNSPTKLARNIIPEIRKIVKQVMDTAIEAPVEYNTPVIL